MTTEEDREFQQVVAEGLVPKIEGSELFVSLCPADDSIDAKFCVELGVAIMLDKPIIAVLSPGRPIPEALRKVATRVIEADIETDEGREMLARELQAM